MEKKKYFICAICKIKYRKREVKGFQVPTCPVRRKRWVDYCQVDFNQNLLVCEKHFKPSDILRGAKTRLLPGALPRLDLVSPETPKNECNRTEDLDILRGGQIRLQPGASPRLDHVSPETPNNDRHQTEDINSEVQFLKQRLKALEEDNRKLRNQLQELLYQD